MNILLINYEFPPIGGGAATATLELARAMQTLGHAVTVLTAGFTSVHGETLESGIRIRRLGSRRTRTDRSSLLEKLSFVVHAAIALPRMVRRSRPDGCIVFFSMPCGPLGQLVRAISGAPYVISLRGGDVPGTEPALDRIHWWLAPIRRWVLRGAAAVVANSAGLKALSEAADPVGAVVIPNGVDMAAYFPRAKSARGTFRFLFVGRCTFQKNVDLLLSAAQILRTLSTTPFVLEIVGDGPLMEKLRARCHGLGLDEIVEWRSWIAREEMPGRYTAANCLVNPSRYEGMPNAVLEGMACGLPVIVSDVAGNIDVVERGVSGFVFPDNDAQALAAAMHTVLEDRIAAAAAGDAGRKRVERAFSWDASARKYVALLNGTPGTAYRAAI